MIKITCFCSPRFHFIGGVVRGEIVVDPTNLFNSILVNTALAYNLPEGKSVLKLISNEISKRAAEGEDTDIVLLDGVVEKTSTLKLSMHEAMDIITEFLHVDTYGDEAKKREKRYVEDFVKIRDYIYACDDCNSLGDTANIVFE